MFLTQFASEALANHIMRAVAITFPTTNWEIALHTADPTSTGAVDEVSTGDWSNYSRATLARDGTDWDAAVDTGAGFRVPNGVIADFGSPTLINPVTVTHFTIWDDNANSWMWAALTTPRIIVDSAPTRFDVGDLGVLFRYDN